MESYIRTKLVNVQCERGIMNECMYILINFVVEPLMILIPLLEFRCTQIWKISRSLPIADDHHFHQIIYPIHIQGVFDDTRGRDFEGTG